ncbi:hypothetical protein [Nocardia sp. NPDC057030]|uniref:hypothetical protein n=1 Tax=unclassified Nocardia TaxID=2637762 RepID=UPI003640D837
MSSDVRAPQDSKHSSATRPPVMAMPDILAMASSGQPAPGQKVSLPSGAVWEGGKVTGTSIITLPGDDPVLVAGDSSVSANGITGDGVQMGSLARAFQEILGAVPRFFANWITTGALNRYDPDANGVRTRTRIVRVSSKTTLSARAAHEGGNDSGDEVVEEPGVPGAGIESRTPQRFAAGGMVQGPGGSRQDLIPARLSHGEFVVNAAATAKALPLLAAINGGWVPSPSYLGAMVQGFADGGLVGGAGSAAQSWRDLLRSPIAPVDAGAPFRPQDFGLFGLVADVLGGIGNAAINAGGAAGAALGSIVAPAFGPGGALSSAIGSGGTAGAPSSASTTGADASDLGEPDPLGAALRVRTEGTPGGLGFGRAYQAPIGTVPTGGAAVESETVRAAGINPMGSLSTALAHGIVGAATEAGSRVGAALGTVLAPALGPDGSLAPVIGAQLGSLIGSKFGGSLSASMTLTGESGLGASGPTSLGAGDPGGGAEGESSAAPQTASGVDATGSGASYSGGAGSGYTYGVSPSAAQPSQAGSYLVRNRPRKSESQGDGAVTPGAASVAPGANDVAPQGDSPVDGTPSVGAAGFGAQSLALYDEIYDPKTASFKDFLNVAGGKLGGDAASAIAPLLGANGNQIIEAGAQFGAAQGDTLGDLYKSVDPEGKWSSSIAAVVKEYTGIDWSPTGTQSPTPQMTRDQQAGLAALQGGLSGLQQHGLVGGVTGAIKGAASTIGSTLGTAAGTLVAPFLGPLGALAPAVGSMIGSMVAGTAAEFVTKPIELVASGVKEELGSGFGLTNLAKGPGGRTARGDIYNFNGMDPKSAAIAVERVRRRRTVAQQRGGGLGR